MNLERNSLDKAIANAVGVIGHRKSYPNSFYPQSAGRILPLLKDVIETPPGRLLDIGCAVGFMAAVTSQFGYEVHCIDTFNNMSDGVIQKFNLHYLKCIIESPPIPYQDNFFDIVILSEVIEHFNYSPLVPLKEIYRILKPGGLLFLTTPNVASIFSIYPLLRGENIYEPIDVSLRDGWQKTEAQHRIFRDMHFRRYNIKEIRYLMQLSGFSIIKYKSLLRGIPSTRNVPKKLFYHFARITAALTNSRFWGDTIYIVAEKPKSAI